jgi:hypothetical protein
VLLMATFEDAVEGGESLALLTSEDGELWGWGPVGDARWRPAEGARWLRDPSVARVGGRWLMAYTSYPGPEHACCFSVTESADLTRWRTVVDVDCGRCHARNPVAWAPSWYVGPGGPLIVASIGGRAPEDGCMRPYALVPRGPGRGWSAPVPLEGDFPESVIDLQLTRVGGEYRLWFKDEEGGGTLQWASAGAPLGPYKARTSGDWAGFGAWVEGPCAVKMGEGRWRLYFDRYPGRGTSFSDGDEGWREWTEARPVVAPIVPSHAEVTRVPAGLLFPPGGRG